MSQVLTPRLRSQAVLHSKKLHQMGWVANHDGNLSIRISGDRLLITATGISKVDIDDAALLITDLDGKVLEGRKKPFSELELHSAAYRAREDVGAVLHAHPPYATAMGVAGASLQVSVLPEFVVSLGAGVPTAGLCLPKTPESRTAVAELATRHNAMLLAGNGVLTLGADLNQAYLRMELVEHYAKIVTLARQMGGLCELAPAHVQKLLEARRKAGLEPGAPKG
ncbi:MAG: class II aldolase/adducin family protein [Deltaproteobacteria bacterium]|nr:class II aldolase/adducin family protein [Deltaproteobacteria bacterium]